MHTMEFAMSLFLISVICVSQVFASDNFNKVLKLRGRIAQCRASCMEKFVVLPATRGYPIKFNYGGNVNMDANNMGCTSETNWKCSMCWDYCESLAVFELTRSQMCADDICLEGCQHACKFMQETSTSSSTTATEAKIVSSSVLPQKGGELKLAEPKVTKKGVVISWTMSQAKLTYAVLGLTRFHDTSVAAWEEIQQTTEHRLILHLGAKYDEILVAAYDSNGLVQKDSKKLVFQLRVKRSVEKSTSLDDNVNEYPLTSPSMFTLFLVTCIVTSCIASAVLIVKYLRNTSKNSIDPVVWV